MVGTLSIFKKYDQHQYAEFKKLFGINMHGYWDILTGFDVVKFDEEFLKVPDGISTSQFLIDHYGTDAESFIRGLLSEKEKKLCLE